MCQRMACGLLLLIPVVSLMGAQRTDDAKKDAQKLEGTWIASAAVRNGDKATDKQLKDAKVIFKGDTVSFLPREKGSPEKTTFKLDPTKIPKEITMSGPEPDLPVRGIYELKDDILKICIRPAGGKRPAEFKADTGSECLLFVLKRDK